MPFGKRSFAPEALIENCQAIVEAVRGARPAAARGVYIKRCTVSSTMGPGLHVNIKDAVVA